MSGRHLFSETMRVESVGDVQSVVDFLLQHFANHETILSALRVQPSEELRTLLTDLVTDCGSRSASRVARGDDGDLLGVCLATSSLLLERQLDRIYSYSFSDEGLRIANSFAQTVFNRVDIPFHVSSQSLRHPLFIVLICVHPEQWGKGIGRSLLLATVEAGKAHGCDGAFSLASSVRSNRLFSHVLRNSPQGVLYNSFRGEFRDPPIVPSDPSECKISLRIDHF